MVPKISTSRWSLVFVGWLRLRCAALGVAVRPLEITVYVLASLLTAVAVTTAGSVGFVGLVPY